MTAKKRTTQTRKAKRKADTPAPRMAVAPDPAAIRAAGEQLRAAEAFIPRSLYFIVPVAIAIRLMRTKIAAGDDFDFGDPLVERAGVTAPRRAAFGHAFTAEQIAKIDAKRASEGAVGQVFFDEIPANWRYPDPKVTG